MTVPTSQATLQNTRRDVLIAGGNAVSVADVNAGAGAVRVTLTGRNGAATLAATAGLTFTAGDGSADAAMTFAGRWPRTPPWTA